MIDQIFEDLTAGVLNDLGGGMYAKLYFRPTGQTANVWFDLETEGFEDFVPVGLQGVLSYDTRPDVRVNTMNWFIAKPTLTSPNVQGFCNLASSAENIVIVFYLKI